MRTTLLCPPILALLAFSLSATAQNDIENVIVETYYITEPDDTLDPEAGPLEPGATTYRVFLDLSAGSSLLAIYGDTSHPLSIASTAPFFNHYDRGRSFAHEVNNGSLDDGSAGLDSWLSFRAASSGRFGIPKSEDPDGNAIAGPENDLGLLANQQAEIGIPLTTADGLRTDTSSAVPEGFQEFGLPVSPLLGDSARTLSFITDSTTISCSVPGVRGVDDANRLLIAQFTTAGELSFCLNIIVRREDGSIVRYVSSDTLLADGETPSGLLCYPPTCGCMDPQYLEFDPTAGCDDGSCMTPIVFGCLDPAACNYDPEANFNLSALCCYGPDSCNGLDPQLVCPGVGLEDPLSADNGVHVFPNPVRDLLTVELPQPVSEPTALFVLDRTGRLVAVHQLNTGEISGTFDLSGLVPGYYFLRLVAAHTRWNGSVAKS